MALIKHIDVARRQSFRAAAAMCVLVAWVGGSACATIAHGRHQDVLVLSEPAGASIRLNGVDVGSTPTVVRMRRRGPAVLLIEKAGHVAASIPVSKTESGWMFANFVFLNPLAAQGMNSTGEWLASAAAWFSGSMTIDVLSGGGFKRPPVVTVTLAPLPTPGVSAPTRPTSARDVAPTAPGCWPRFDLRPFRRAGC